MNRFLYSAYLGINCVVSNLMFLVHAYFYNSLSPADQHVLHVVNAHLVRVMTVGSNFNYGVQFWRLWVTFFNLSAANCAMGLQFMLLHIMLGLLAAATLVKLNLIQTYRFDGVHNQDPCELAAKILKLILLFVVPFDLAINCIYLVLQVPSLTSIDQYLVGGDHDGADSSSLSLLLVGNTFYVGVTIGVLAYVQAAIRRRRQLAANSRISAVVLRQNNNANVQEDNGETDDSILPLSYIVAIVCIGIAVFLSYFISLGEVPGPTLLSPVASNVVTGFFVYSPGLVAFLKLRYAQNRLPVVSFIMIKLGRRNSM